MAGLGALFAAPAIVKASSLMVVAPTEIITVPAGNSLLTIHQITREACRLFVNSNAFIRQIDRQYRLDEYSERIMRPHLDRFERQIADSLFSKMDVAPDWLVTAPTPIVAQPEIPAAAAMAVGAAAVLAKNPTVSRRFWGA